MNGTRQWMILTNTLNQTCVRLCVCGSRGEAVWQATWQLVGEGVVQEARWRHDRLKKTSTVLQDGNPGWQKDSRRNPVKQSVLLFPAQTRHIALTPQVFLFVGTLTKNFSSSFRSNGGSKQTQTAGHEVSTYSLCCYRTSVLTYTWKSKKIPAW